MSAYLTTKCPQCRRITSHCLDSRLTAPRFEFDRTRCWRCVKYTNKDGTKKEKRPSRMKRYSNRQAMALVTPSGHIHY